MTNDSKIEPAWLDRSPGSGSLTWAEAKRDETARRPTHDMRAETRTTFYEEGHHSDPSESSTWTELAAWNDDMRHPDRGTQNHYADRRRTIEIICSTLDCTEYQRNRTEWLIDEIGNLREFSPTTTVESITLAAASLVIDEDTTTFANRVSNRDEFERLVDDFDLSTSDVWSLREKIRQETDAFE